MRGGGTEGAVAFERVRALGSLARELFVLLATEPNGHVSDKQRSMVSNALTAAEDASIHNLFLCTHGPLWVVDNPVCHGVQPHLNGTRFEYESAKLAGDIGLPRSRTLFFETDGHVTYPATGLGETDEDSLVLARVDRGRVKLERWPLTDRASALALADFDARSWREHFASQSPSVLERAWGVGTSGKSWAGISAGVLLALVVRRWRRT